MGEPGVISEAYLNYLREVLRREDVNPAVRTSAYIEFVEQNGFLPAGVDAVDISSWKDPNKTSIFLKQLEEDSNYILNDRDAYQDVLTVDTSTDSFFIEALEIAPNTNIDAAFGYSDLTGTYHQASSYIDPYDPYVLQLLSLLKEKGLINGKTSADNRAKAVYNYILQYFDYIADNKGDDWNFAGETILAQGGDCEDLSILLVSLGIAALMDGGLSYGEASRRFTAVAGAHKIYGDHVYVEYIDGQDRRLVMDPSMGTQGILTSLDQLQTAESWEQMFVKYFIFNDNQIVVRPDSVAGSEQMPKEITSGRPYIDPNNMVIQSFVDELIGNGLLAQRMSTDKLVVDLYNYISTNFKLLENPRDSWNFSDTTLNIKSGNVAELSMLFLNTAIAALHRFDGVDTTKIFKLSYGKLDGADYAFIKYTDTEGVARVIDLGGKLNPPKDCYGLKPGDPNPFGVFAELNFLSPLKHPRAISDFDLSSELNARYIEEGIFNMQDSCWQKRVIQRLNPRFQLGHFVDKDGLVDDRGVDLGDLPAYDPTKFNDKPTAAELGIRLQDIIYTNSDNKNKPTMLDTSWAGNILVNEIQKSVRDTFNTEKYYDTSQDFWSFKEEAFEAEREKVRWAVGVYTAFAMIAQAGAAARNLVEEEMTGNQGYKQMNIENIVQSEGQLVMKGIEQVKSSIIENVDTHNKVWRQALDKWVGAKRNWMATNSEGLTYALLTIVGGVVASGLILGALIQAAYTAGWLTAGPTGMVSITVGYNIAIILAYVAQWAATIGLVRAGVAIAKSTMPDSYKGTDNEAIYKNGLEGVWDDFLLYGGITLGVVATVGIISSFTKAVDPTQIGLWTGWGIAAEFVAAFFAFFGLGQSILELKNKGRELDYLEQQYKGADTQKTHTTNAIAQPWVAKGADINNPPLTTDPQRKVSIALDSSPGNFFDVMSDYQFTLATEAANVSEGDGDDYSLGRDHLRLRQEKSLAYEAKLITAQNIMRIYSRLYQEMDGSRSEVHQEMTGVGGRQRASSPIALVNTELSIYNDIFTRIRQAKEAYVRKFNEWETKHIEKQKATVEMIGQVAAYFVGLALLPMPKIDYGPSQTMAIAQLATTIINMFLPDWYMPPAIGMASSASYEDDPDARLSDLKPAGFADSYSYEEGFSTSSTTIWDVLEGVEQEDDGLRIKMDGYAAYGGKRMVDREPVIRARNAMVRIATTEKMIVMLKAAKTDSRNFVHQEMTNKGGRASWSQDIVSIIDSELQFGLSVLAAMVSRQEQFVIGKNKMVRTWFDNLRKILVLPWKFAKPPVNFVGPIVETVYYFAHPGADHYDNFENLWNGTNYSDSENSFTVSNGIITKANVIRDDMKLRDLFYQHNHRDYPDKDDELGTAFWNDSVELNINRMMQRVQDIVNQGAFMNAWASIFGAAGKGRATVHQEMTGVSSKQQSSIASGIVRGESNTAFQNFQDQIQMANALKAVINQKIRANKQLVDTAMKGILGIVGIIMWVTMLETKFFSSLYAFITACWDMLFAVYESVSAANELARKKKRKEDNIATAFANDNDRQAMDRDTKAMDDLENRQAAEMEEMLNNAFGGGDSFSSAGAAGAGANMGMIDKINKIRDSMMKVKEGQAQSRANVKAVTTGITGAAGFATAQAVGSLHGRGATLLAAQIISSLEARSQEISALKSAGAAAVMKMWQAGFSMLSSVLEYVQIRQKKNKAMEEGGLDEDQVKALEERLKEAKSGEPVELSEGEKIYLQAMGYDVKGIMEGNDDALAEVLKGFTSEWDDYVAGVDSEYNTQISKLQSLKAKIEKAAEAGEGYKPTPGEVKLLKEMGINVKEVMEGDKLVGEMSPGDVKAAVDGGMAETIKKQIEGIETARDADNTAQKNWVAAVFGFFTGTSSGYFSMKRTRVLKSNGSAGNQPEMTQSDKELADSTKWVFVDSSGKIHNIEGDIADADLKKMKLAVLGPDGEPLEPSSEQKELLKKYPLQVLVGTSRSSTADINVELILGREDAIRKAIENTLGSEFGPHIPAQFSYKFGFNYSEAEVVHHGRLLYAKQHEMEEKDVEITNRQAKEIALTDLQQEWSHGVKGKWVGGKYITALSIVVKANEKNGKTYSDESVNAANNVRQKMIDSGAIKEDDQREYMGVENSGDYQKVADKERATELVLGAEAPAKKPIKVQEKKIEAKSKGDGKTMDLWNLLFMSLDLLKKIIDYYVRKEQERRTKKEAETTISSIREKLPVLIQGKGLKGFQALNAIYKAREEQAITEDRLTQAQVNLAEAMHQLYFDRQINSFNSSDIEKKFGAGLFGWTAFLAKETQIALMKGASLKKATKKVDLFINAAVKSLQAIKAEGSPEKEIIDAKIAALRRVQGEYKTRMKKIIDESGALSEEALQNRIAETSRKFCEVVTAVLQSNDTGKIKEYKLDSDVKVLKPAPGSPKEAVDQLQQLNNDLSAKIQDLKKSLSDISKPEGEASSKVPESQSVENVDGSSGTSAVVPDKPATVQFQNAQMIEARQNTIKAQQKLLDLLEKVKLLSIGDAEQTIKDLEEYKEKFTVEGSKEREQIDILINKVQAQIDITRAEAVEEGVKVEGAGAREDKGLLLAGVKYDKYAMADELGGAYLRAAAVRNFHSNITRSEDMHARLDEWQGLKNSFENIDNIKGLKIVDQLNGTNKYGKKIAQINTLLNEAESRGEISSEERAQIEQDFKQCGIDLGGGEKVAGEEEEITTAQPSEDKKVAESQARLKSFYSAQLNGLYTEVNAIERSITMASSDQEVQNEMLFELDAFEAFPEFQKFWKNEKIDYKATEQKDGSYEYERTGATAPTSMHQYVRHLNNLADVSHYGGGNSALALNNLRSSLAGEPPTWTFGDKQGEKMSSAEIEQAIESLTALNTLVALNERLNYTNSSKMGKAGFKMLTLGRVGEADTKVRSTLTKNHEALEALYDKPGEIPANFDVDAMADIDPNTNVATANYEKAADAINLLVDTAGSKANQDMLKDTRDILQAINDFKEDMAKLSEKDKEEQLATRLTTLKTQIQAYMNKYGSGAQAAGKQMLAMADLASGNWQIATEGEGDTASRKIVDMSINAGTPQAGKGILAKVDTLGVTSEQLKVLNEESLQGLLIYNLMENLPWQDNKDIGVVYENNLDGAESDFAKREPGATQPSVEERQRTAVAFSAAELFPIEEDASAADKEKIEDQRLMFMQFMTTMITTDQTISYAQMQQAISDIKAGRQVTILDKEKVTTQAESEKVKVPYEPKTAEEKFIKKLCDGVNKFIEDGGSKDYENIEAILSFEEFEKYSPDEEAAKLIQRTEDIVNDYIRQSEAPKGFNEKVSAAKERYLEALGLTSIAVPGKPESTAEIQTPAAGSPGEEEVLKASPGEEEIKEASEALAKKSQQNNADKTTLQSFIDDTTGNSEVHEKGFKALLDLVRNGGLKGPALMSKIKEIGIDKLSKAELKELIEVMEEQGELGGILTLAEMYEAGGTDKENPVEDILKKDPELYLKVVDKYKMRMQRSGINAVSPGLIQLKLSKGLGKETLRYDMSRGDFSSAEADQLLEMNMTQEQKAVVLEELAEKRPEEVGNYLIKHQDAYDNMSVGQRFSIRRSLQRSPEGRELLPQIKLSEAKQAEVLQELEKYKEEQEGYLGEIKAIKDKKFSVSSVNNNGTDFKIDELDLSKFHIKRTELTVSRSVVYQIIDKKTGEQMYSVMNSK
ncbi:transglutaminase family protein [Candidatus Margulisiibacteriota bacterium]